MAKLSLELQRVDRRKLEGLQEYFKCGQERMLPPPSLQS